MLEKRDIQADKADLVIPEESNPEHLYLITVYSDPKDNHILQSRSFLIRKGEVVKKVPEEQIVEVLRQELLKMAEGRE